MDSILKQLMTWMWGFVPSRCLQIAIRAGLFEYISTSHPTTDELSEHFSFSHRWASALLLVLNDIGLIVKRYDRWQMSEEGNKWTLKNSEHYLGDFIVRSETLYNAYTKLDDSMKSGEPNPIMRNMTLDAFGEDDVETRNFAASMKAMSIDIGEELAKHLYFLDKGKILDVGCGVGAIALAIAQRLPNTDIVAFDLPKVAKLCREFIASNKAAHKISVLSSSWNDWDWRKQYDCVLLSQVLHELDSKESSILFRNAVQALNVGGLVIVIAIAKLSQNDPDILPSIFRMNMLMEIGGDNTDIGWITCVFEQNNISMKDKIILPGGRVAYIGEKIANKGINADS